MILAGVEIHRFGLHDELLRAGRGGEHPHRRHDARQERRRRAASAVRRRLRRARWAARRSPGFVEESDCVILLGEFMTDINMGIFTANLDPGQCIYATSEELRISHHHYDDVLLEDFIDGLAAAGLKAPPRTLPRGPKRPTEPFELEPASPITIRRLIDRLNQSLDGTMVVIADPGDALFASSELVIHRQTEFLSPAYYTSMGFAVPAALGAMVARPKLRPIVLVGDGAFQMTGMELSTIVRHGFHPIVIVLDNQGYGTERVLLPGEHEFNDIHPWHYHKLPEVLGGGKRLRSPHGRRLRRRTCHRPGRQGRPAHPPRPSWPGRLQHDAGAVDEKIGAASLITPHTARRSSGGQPRCGRRDGC